MPGLNHFITSIIKDIDNIEKENALKDNILILKENVDKFETKNGLTPRSLKRARSSENFIKYQWAWTL
jgi:hypothetical protein